MGKKKDETAFVCHLTEKDLRELEALMDRLNVQDPEGESFATWLESLIRLFHDRETHLVALLDMISKHPSPAGLKAFEAIKQAIKSRKMAKITRKLEYRMSLKGFETTKNIVKAKKVPLLKDFVLEDIQAYLCHWKGGAAFSLFMYLPPTLKESGHVVILDIMADNFSFAYKAKPSFETKVLKVPKKVFKEYLTKASEHPVSIIPISSSFAESLFMRCLSNAEKYSAPEEIALKLLSNRRSEPFIADVSFRPPYISPGQWFAILGKELNLSETDPVQFSKTDVTRAVSFMDPVILDEAILTKIIEDLAPFINSHLLCDPATRIYHIERTVFNFFCNLKEQHHKYYSFFICLEAVGVAKIFHERELSLLLLITAKSLEAGQGDHYKDLVTKHLIYSICYACASNSQDQSRHFLGQMLKNIVFDNDGEEFLFSPSHKTGGNSWFPLIYSKRETRS